MQPLVNVTSPVPEGVRRREWISRFVTNLYGDGHSRGPDERLVAGPAYRVARAWVVDHHLEGRLITTIKAFHTAVFLVIMGLIVHFTYSGIRNRITRWTLLTLGAVVGEGLVLGANDGRCPLTIVVEDLGSEHGEVADIFLPGWVARHIAHVSSGLIAVGVAAMAVHRIVKK